MKISCNVLENFSLPLVRQKCNKKQSKFYVKHMQRALWRRQRKGGVACLERERGAAGREGGALAVTS